MTFDRVRTVADAVLFEGYALYPYRPSSKKNASRWQFGVLVPREAAESGSCDPCWLETQCLVEGTEGRVEGKLRFLQAKRRSREWDEGEVREIDFEAPLTSARTSMPFECRGDSLVAGIVHVRVEALHAPSPLARLSVRVDNVTPWTGGTGRQDTVHSSLLGAHLMLRTHGSPFVSLIDPPAWAEPAAAACRNTRVFPVLAGEPGQRDLVLASPIILYDYPQVAPESPQDLFDATEIDEILTLRTRSLTDDEKREARAADPRIAALIDRVDGLTEPELIRMHGVLRPVGPDVHFAPGERVRLRPGRRRSDAQDFLLDGKLATVRAVLRDVDGRDCVAVTIDDDPAAELHAWHGRFHYFQLDEVERIASPG
jgi:hypothetical protein